jgi:hypothetical protein
MIKQYILPLLLNYQQDHFKNSYFYLMYIYLTIKNDNKYSQILNTIEFHYEINIKYVI